MCFFLQAVPSAVAERIGSRKEVKVRINWGKTMKTWPVKVSVAGKKGRMYLTSGWAAYVEANKLLAPDFIVFSYYVDHGDLAVKVFDPSGCRRIYPEGGPVVANL